MSDEQFEIFLLTDDEVRINNQKQKEKQKSTQSNTQSKKIITGDKYLDEIEKAFDKGDMIDVDALLKNL